jgi:membrane protease YdiL (CAAX protease family)
MIQRLLRGRLLYWGLGLLIVFLYARMMPVKVVESHAVADAPQTDEAAEWWPNRLDGAALQQIAVREPRIAITVLVLSVCIVGMGLSGFALALWGVWTGRIRSVWRFTSRRLPRWSFGELGRITALILMITSLLPFVRLAILSLQVGGGDDPHLWVTVSMLFLDAFAILAILTFAVGKGRSVWKTFGFSTRHLWPSIVAGFRGYLAVFPWLFILLFLVVELARHFGLKPPMEPIQELVFEEHRPGILALTVLLACVIGPVAEELFFRGVVYPAIRQRTSRMVAMLMSGAAFSLIHANLLGFLPIMALGCLLANLYERTGSLAGPLAIHVLHNTLLMSLALVFRQLMALS